MIYCSFLENGTKTKIDGQCKEIEHLRLLLYTLETSNEDIDDVRVNKIEALRIRCASSTNDGFKKNAFEIFQHGQTLQKMHFSLFLLCGIYFFVIHVIFKEHSKLSKEM